MKALENYHHSSLHKQYRKSKVAGSSKAFLYSLQTSQQVFEGSVFLCAWTREWSCLYIQALQELPVALPAPAFRSADLCSFGNELLERLLLGLRACSGHPAKLGLSEPRVSG